MKAYLIYCGLFVFAAVIAASGISEFLFYSHEAAAWFFVFGVLPGGLLVFALDQRLPRPAPAGLMSEARLNVLLWGWALMALVDFASQGYVPILALARGDGVYTDFKPPLHGFTNALSLAYMCGSPFVRTRRSRLGVWAIILFQIAIVNRGPAFYHVVAWAIGYAARQASEGTLRLRRYVIGGGVGVMLFGAAGSLRQGADFIVHEAFGVRDEYRWIPGGLVWALIYISSPTSNLLYNISLRSLICRPAMLTVLSTLVPGPIRNAVLGHVPTGEAYLPCEITGDLYYPSLNVSTGFIQFYMDFGVAGLVIPSLLVGGIAWYLSRPLREWRPMHSLMCVLLFVNLFAPSFNQLSFVVAFVVVRMLTRDMLETAAQSAP